VLSIYQEIIDRYRDDAHPALRLQVVMALVNHGQVLTERQRFEDALIDYQQVIDGYTEDSAESIRDQVIMATISKAVALTDHLDRHEEALDAFQQIIDPYSAESALVPREGVARALIGKASVLGKLGRWTEAFGVYELIINRYKDDTAPGIRVQVASVLRQEFDVDMRRGVQGFRRRSWSRRTALDCRSSS
jgi:tetratricopeptide (TPR) repeat protein